MKIRVVRTASKARAVQIVRYHNNARVIVHHVGSAHSDAEFEKLVMQAEEWIKDYSQQLSFFPDENPNVLLSTTEYWKIENWFFGVAFTSAVRES